LQNDPSAAQLVHAPPPPPQASLPKPVTHEPSGWQQPLHVPGPHFATQAPPVHAWFVIVQSWHCPLPGLPHAPSWLPTTHVLPWQQPVLHVSGPHVGTWQAPDWQTSPWFTQFWHWLPPRPHAVFWLPTAQMSPTQHPTQFDGSQRPAGMHTPESASQVVPLVHVVHCLPPTPHAPLVVAITH
jgi:hypothetical protein